MIYCGEDAECWEQNHDAYMLRDRKSLAPYTLRLKNGLLMQSPQLGR